jgi:hypothetical protein
VRTGSQRSHAPTYALRPQLRRGLYSDYTCSDDDVYPEAKGKIGNSASSCSSKFAISGSSYVVDYDSVIMIEVGSYIGDDDIYPLVQGEISYDSVSPSGRHCMMASHGDGNEHGANSNRDRPSAGGRYITQNQIRHARKVYSGRYLWALIPAPKRWPHFDSSSSSRRTRSAARDESWNDAEMKLTRPADDVPSYHHITHRASRADHDLISHLGAMRTTSPETWRQNLMRLS